MNETELRQRLEVLAGVHPSREATSRALDRVRRTLLDNNGLQARKSIWRILMESKMTRLAAAAAIVVAVFSVFRLPGGRSGVALGRVLDSIQGIRAYVHRATLTTQTGSEPAREIDFTIWRSVDYGVRRDCYSEGNLISRLYVPPSGTDVVELLPRARKYINARLDEKQLMEINHKTDPQELIKFFTGFEYEPLDPQVIDGVSAVGIEIDDPHFGKALFERGWGRLWVDPKTELPVRIEMEGTSAKGTTHIRVVADQFQWDAPLTQAEFEPNIPPDYTVMADVDLSGREETLVKGLRAFARIAGGRYPSSLDLMTASQEIRSAFLIDRRKRGVAIETPPTKEEMENLLAIQGAGLFYGDLVQGKDPAYYGAQVTAEFPHAVLMRWSVDETTYRIVLGDLTVHDVAAGELAHWEAVPLNTESYPLKPQPADGMVGTAVDSLRLAWLPGTAAVEHRLYFGTNPNHLPLLATVKDTQFADLPRLERNTNYFWRVDELNAHGSITPGNLWSFDTGRLVGWWKLDETAGTSTADAGSHEHVGVLVGNLSWTEGAVGSALEFDGEGDYVDLGTAADFDITNQITVCAWIKVRVFTVDWQTIIAKGDTAWRLSRDQGDNLHFACTGLWPEWVRGTANVNDGQWHHAAGVYDGSELRLYIDGKLDASAKTQGSINVSKFPVWIGDNSEEPGRGWNGLIDDVRIYNYALSQAEIDNLAQKGERSR